MLWLLRLPRVDRGGVWASAGGAAAPAAGCWPLATLARPPRPNQSGKPWRRLKPPGGRRSSSVALTVPLSWMSVVYMYVVKGVISGWNMSVEKVTRGGRSGYESGKEIWKRRMAVA